MIRFSPAPGLSLALILVLVVLIALGVWQVQRLQWKTEILAQIAQGETAAPEPLADLLDREKTGLMIAWRRAQVRGKFYDQAPQPIFANREGRPAVRLLVPFVMADGLAITLDLGYLVEGQVPHYDKAWRLPGASGELTFNGVLKPLRRPGPFAPVNEAGKLWFTPDAARLLAPITDARPITGYVLYVEGARQHRNWPQPAPAHANIPNNHLDYALTWFGLALAALGVYAGWHVRAGRLSFGKSSA